MSETDNSGISTNNTNEITLNVDVKSIVSLCQNLNSNLLVNTIAYNGVLSKLKDNPTFAKNSEKIAENIKSLEQIQLMVSDLMRDVQVNLDVPKEQQIDPIAVINKATETNYLTDQLISAQVSSILASLAAAAVLLGGSKRNYTKRNRNKRYKSKSRKHSKRY